MNGEERFFSTKLRELRQQGETSLNNALLASPWADKTPHTFKQNHFLQSTAPAGLVVGVFFLIINPILGFVLIGMGAWVYKMTLTPSFVL